MANEKGHRSNGRSASPSWRLRSMGILNVIWAPHMTIMPHNHQMWAVIGIYTGREDNIFWRRVPGAHGGKLEAVGARALSTKDADPLGHNIIHSVTNPIARLPGAIHDRRWAPRPIPRAHSCETCRPPMQRGNRPSPVPP